MLGFQELSDSIDTFISDGGVIKINDMVMGLYIMVNPRAFGCSFDIPYEGSAFFTNIHVHCNSTNNICFSKIQNSRIALQCKRICDYTAWTNSV